MFLPQTLFVCVKRAAFRFKEKIKSEERFASGISPVYGINRRL